MLHLDPDRLVLLALAEESEDPVDAAHLAECAGCRQDLEAFRAVAGLGAEGQDLQDLEPPPERIWHAIEAEISSPPPVVRSIETARRRRSRPRWLAPVVAAAAAAVIAAAGTVAAFQLTDRPAEQITAQATLTPLETVPGNAGGSVRVLADGRMRIDVRNLPLTTGFHEVWLIDPDDVSRMVAIGNLGDGPDVVLPVPPGTDLNRYRLVDVSDEPHDGDVTHSGRSLLRGTLTS